MTRSLLFRAALPRQQVAAQAALESGYDGLEIVCKPESKVVDPAIPESLPFFEDAYGNSQGLVRAWAVSLVVVDSQQAVEQLSDLLDRASLAGVVCLNVTLPPVVHTEDQPGLASYQEGLNFAYDLLRGLRYRAERNGVPLALEAAVGGCLFSPVELRELIQAVNSWAVGVCVDAPCVAGVGGLKDWIETLRGCVHAVRVEGPSIGPDIGSNPSAARTVFDSVLDTVLFNGPVIVRDPQQRG